MTVFLTVNTLFYICIALLILLVSVWVYARNINKRLDQSINLINDLYKLSQDQAKNMSELLGYPQDSEQSELPENNKRPSNATMLDQIVRTTVAEEKSSIVKELADIESRSFNNITQLTSKIEQRILALENQTEQLQQDSPELKMYKRAIQLVKEGASINDVMEASQLPRAEVEVLIGLHRHKSKPSAS